MNFAVLGVSICLEGYSFGVAWKELRAQNPAASPIDAVTRSKDPTVFAVLCEDAAALTGLVIAILGVGLAHALAMPVFDGLASLGIGGVLVLTAVFLARETLSLITGESASREVRAGVRRTLENDRRITNVEEILTMHLGPNEILLAASLDFDDALTGEEIENGLRHVSGAITRDNPSITRVFVRPVQRRTADEIKAAGEPAAAARTAI